MKTLARTLIILAVFAVVVIAMETSVNAIGLIMPDFGGEPPHFRPDEGGEELRPPNEGENPEREEHDREEGGFRSLRMMFGFGKNILVIGFLVAAIVLPKSFFKKKKDGMKPSASTVEAEEEEDLERD